MAEDGGFAQDDEMGTTLASERLGIDIFSMVRERRQKAGLKNPKKNSDSLKTVRLLFFYLNEQLTSNERTDVWAYNWICAYLQQGIIHVHVRQVLERQSARGL